MRTVTTLHAAGESHPGLQRLHNEDRWHCDEARGIFVVVDGVGGQAAGEKAADTAIASVRARLERQTGRTEDRVREAIAIANDEIYRLASLRPEWKGMACVLTAVVVDNGDVVVGHVGDTRLYRIHAGRLEKITRDHSPVGEREDAREISEATAMHHPRRNEVFRDVGSEPHHPDDPDFIDVARVPFPRDAALLLCSDGLTDVVDSAAITRIIETFAGRPRDVVRELIDAANDAGGKDNITAVYVEGEQFAAGRRTTWPDASVEERTRVRTPAETSQTAAFAPASAPATRSTAVRRWVQGILLVLLVAVVLLGLAFGTRAGQSIVRMAGLQGLPYALGRVNSAPSITVAQGQSIAAALAAASPGTEIRVEPGEYREALTLRPGVRLVSRVPRQAVIRLSGGASDNEAVVTINQVSGAEFVGFRILGDAATPMGTGIYVNRADPSIVDIEISGAKNAGIEYDAGSGGLLLGSDLIDNFGSALVARAGAAPRVSHNRFARNATAEGPIAPLVIDPATAARFDANVFDGVRADAFPRLKDGNWFVPPPAPAPQPARRGRK